jgi:hypothetical protein
MHGPPLTRLEVAAVLRREVGRLVSLGVEQPVAIRAVAREQGIDPEWVAELVASIERALGGDL